MNILNTHDHKLRFYIDKDVPKEYIKRWSDFKLKCESGVNIIIVEQIKSYCKLKMNQNIPYLNRAEGGIGGDNNIINKQIRFRDNISSKYIDDDIIFEQIVSTETEKWTYEELDDLIRAFIKVCNNVVQTECVNGCIELVHQNTYLDS
jgi:hypothetical protein